MSLHEGKPKAKHEWLRRTYAVSEANRSPPQPKEQEPHSHNGCSTSAFRKRQIGGVKGVSNIEKRDKHDKIEKIEKVKFELFYTA